MKRNRLRGVAIIIIATVLPSLAAVALAATAPASTAQTVVTIAKNLVADLEKNR